MMKELWKSVAGYEGLYEVSNFGRVKSLAKIIMTGTGPRQMKEKILKDHLIGTGYHIVTLCSNDSPKHKSVARLVAEAFLSDWQPSLTVDHINGIKADNRPENLRMLTQQQNSKAFQKKRGNTTSRFRGVSWYKRYNKWVSSIGKAQRVYVGAFDSEIEAAKARDKIAIELGYLEEALNFPL